MISGLIEQFKLSKNERFAQVELERTPDLHLGIHLRLEESIDPPSVLLGAIKRHIGILHQAIGVVAVIGRNRNTDAGADDDLMAFDIKGFTHRLDKPRRERGRVYGLLSPTCTIANSSPPSRATKSIARTHARSRSETACKRTSPIG